MHPTTLNSAVQAAVTGLMLLAAPAASAADHPLLTTVVSLCRPNHSRPAEVAAAAKSSGWTEAMAVGAGGATLIKSVDGGSQILILSAKPITLADGAPAVFNACQASGDVSDGTLLASVRAFMGRDPQVSSGPRAASWLFTEHDGQRRFLPDGSLTAVAAALKSGPVVIARVPPSGRYVEYNEISSVP